MGRVMWFLSRVMKFTTTEAGDELTLLQVRNVVTPRILVQIQDDATRAYNDPTRFIQRILVYHQIE